MSAENDKLVAAMLHHRTGTIGAGESIPLPIELASVFMLPGTLDVPHQYGRVSNPTWKALEDVLSILENAEVLTFPSGMAAISAVLMAHLKSGDRLLLPSDGYWTTRALVEKYLVPNGIQVEQCPTADYGDRDLTGFRMVFIETPSNPTLELCDIAAIAAKAKAAGAITVVDNTTMTPLGQRPLDLGADIVLSSDTKAINGHSDVLFGHVASRDPDLLGPIGEWRKFIGATPGPFETWLVYRGLKSLEVRYERMCKNAATVADRLAGHGVVSQVRFPGLPNHPGHAIARKQMTTFGTIMGLGFASADLAERFIAAAPFIVPTTSFGSVHTSAERRARWGDQVAEGYVRLSIGCEPTEVLWQNIAEALDTLR